MLSRTSCSILIRSSAFRMQLDPTELVLLKLRSFFFFLGIIEAPIYTHANCKLVARRGHEWIRESGWVSFLPQFICLHAEIWPPLGLVCNHHATWALNGTRLNLIPVKRHGPHLGGSSSKAKIMDIGVWVEMNNEHANGTQGTCITSSPGCRSH
jgi:hypothetical protein